MRLFLLLLGYALLLESTVATAQCEQAEITPASLVAQNIYGTACSASGNRVAVGAPGGGGQAEAVYIYKQSGRNWFLEQAIPSPNPFGTILAFGQVVSLDGDRLAVGCPGHSPTATGQGVVILYEFDGKSWVLQQTVAATDPTRSAFLGGSAELKGDRLVVGARGDSTIANAAGAAYVFDFDGTSWVESAKLLGSDTQGGDFFGDSISFEDDRVIVGARLSDPGGVGSGGAAYVFDKNGSTWLETAKIVPADVSQSDEFSVAVELDSEFLFVASKDDDLGGSAGAVYVFQEQAGTWVQTQKLLAQDGSSGDFFGLALDSDGVTLAIGALGENSDQGSAYLFGDQGSGWVQIAKVSALNGEDDDSFGTCVGIDGDALVIGARFGDANGSDLKGRAWCFSVDGIACPSFSTNRSALSLSQGGTAKLDLFPGASEAGGNYWVIGTVSGTDPGFPLGSFQVPINLDDYFLLSLLPNPASPLLNNIGTLNAQGRASAFLTVASMTDPSLVGLTLEHAYAVYSLGPLTFRHVSNPVTVILEQ